MVAQRLAEVRQRVAAAVAQAGRQAEDVTLVAVSKGRSPQAIMQAYEQGQRDFGENRAQELAEKAPQLPGDIRWHFIGSLQTRQAKIARPHTYLLHSLDRTRLANSWMAAGAAPPALLQINVAAEPQKHGANPDVVDELCEGALAAGVRCGGLMTIPPLAGDPNESRKWFAALRELRDTLSSTYPELTDLSMGMTDDFEVAIQEGATIIRVGRAIFGPSGVPATID